MKKVVRIPEDAEIPLIGLVQIGIIDRGTNLLQLRTTTLCNLNCIFCSTDSGNYSKYHQTEYIVSLDYFIDWLKEIVKFKKEAIAFIDSVGEPLTYQNFFDLVSEISQLDGIKSIALETNGCLLDEKKIEELEELGLNWINLSLHSLDQEKNKKLTGNENYDTKKILEIISCIAESDIDLVLTPVWIPGINDYDIQEIIEFAKSKIKNKKYPIIGIQKYEAHKFGRRVKNVKPMSWRTFYQKLAELEKKIKINLRLRPDDFDIVKTKSLPIVFKNGEKVKVEIKTDGWMKNERIGVAKDRSITVVNCNANPGKILSVRILRNKDNIYIAR